MQARTVACWFAGIALALGFLWWTSPQPREWLHVHHCKPGTGGECVVYEIPRCDDDGTIPDGMVGCFNRDGQQWAPGY